MVEQSELRVGLLIWWEADREFSEWSCPAVVTEVTEDWFKVRTLDEFKETEPLRMNDNGDETSRREMRVCGIDEVKKFFLEKNREFEDSLTETKRRLEDLETEKANFASQVEAFLATVK
jgi:hypothetical protein